MIDDLTSLDGTTWVRVSTPDADKPNEMLTITFVFTATNYTATAVDHAGRTSVSDKGTYSYLAPIVALTSTDGGTNENGKISGNELAINDVKFIKQ